MPSLQVTLAFVAACGGDDEAWRRHWHAATSGYTQPPFGGRKRRPTLFQRRGTPPHPAQLPPRPRGFTGRAAELAWLRSPRDTPMVISGPAGVGKSDLALHHAHAIAAEENDGQLYADLGGLRHGGGAPPAPATADVLDGFLRALGVDDDQLAGTFDHRAGLYRTLLAERRLVVVLDNVQDEQQVRPLLAETTTSTTLLVSRKRLLGLRDVHRLQLTPLPRGDSIAMITAALPHVAVSAGHDCDRLAELCGDLPLALDLALRKIASRPRLTLRRVVEEWRLNGNTVDWLSVGDLSLRDSLESAYRTLEPARARTAGAAGANFAGCTGSVAGGAGRAGRGDRRRRPAHARRPVRRRPRGAVAGAGLRARRRRTRRTRPLRPRGTGVRLAPGTARQRRRRPRLLLENPGLIVLCGQRSQPSPRWPVISTARVSR